MDVDEGRKPHREEKVEPKVYYMGDHAPFPGQVPGRSDEDIKRDVDTALFYDDVVSSLGVKVSVSNGIVTLDGQVNSDQAKRSASEDAWEVAGVKDVKNQLQVNETSTPSRAAGEDMVEAKPPEPIFGEPVSQPEGQKQQEGQSQQGQQTRQAGQTEPNKGP
ncbi:MAG TPA: BON domain-containing protein [Chloroflexota bacterium]|nr:BON domain-containing protein [Chloroflexota bacterium]